jgi:HlyD family secretion protein
VELTAKAQEAVREVERVRRSAAAEIAKVKTDLEAATVTARLEQAQLAKLRKQVEACTVVAPQAGILIYSNDKNNRVQLGAMVHFQQKLFSLPDLGELNVKAYIHESVINKVKPGLNAEIRIEAQPGAVLHGKVAGVATFFDSTRFWMQGVKEYVTTLSIEDLPDAGLKPGMTAEVKILVSELQDVLLVPLQAVTETEGEHIAYVVDSGVERRPVVVGETDGKFIEIKNGLQAGERLLLNARSFSSRGKTAENTAGPRN